MSRALTSDPKARGNWGEFQLEGILQGHGLRESREYDKEKSETSDEGQRRRLDFVLHLPDNKDIVIDSEVTVNAFLELDNADTPEEVTAASKKHLGVVKQHIKDLSSKSYTDLVKGETFGHVIMFMPIEGAFLAAVREDITLQ